jgi:hypothetical protein
MEFKAVLAYESKKQHPRGATPRIGCQDASSAPILFVKTAARQRRCRFRPTG